MSGVTLRAARPTDAGTVGAILQGFLVDTPWMPKLYSGAETISFAGTMIDRGWVRVAENAEQVCGFLARDGTEVHALYVAATRQGQGVGSALIQAAQRETERLSLWTFQANVAAQAFYDRHGFAEVQRTDGTRNDEGLPDLEMVWHKECV